MKRLARPWLFGVGLVALAGVATGAVLSRGSSSLGGARTAAASKAKVPAEYSLDLDNTLQLASGELRVRLTGTLTWAQTTRAGTWLLQITPTLAELSQSGGAPRPLLGVELPCFVELDAAGKPTRLSFDKTVARETRRTVEFLVALLQHPQPPQGELTQPEHDAMGAYSARYVKAADGAIERRKLAYDVTPGRPTLVVEQSLARFVLDSQGIAALSVAERLTLQELSLVAQTKLGFVRTARRPTLSAKLLQGPGAKQESFAFGNVGQPTAAEIDALTAAGISLETALAELRASPDKKWSWANLSKLAAHLRQEPADVAKVAALALGEESLQDALLQLLGECGSSEAQQELLRLTARNAASHELRAMCLARLSQTEQPLLSSVEWLAREGRLPSSDIRDNAVQVRGILLKRAADARLPWQAAQERSYVAEARDASAPSTTRAYFAGLAALGDGPSLDLLLAALGASSSERRATAVYSLRNVQTPAVDAAFLALAEREQDARVLDVLFRSVAARHPERYVAAAERLLVSGHVATSIGGSALGILSHAARTDQRARLVLQRAAAAHPDSTLRAQAQNALENLARGTAPATVETATAAARSKADEP